MADVYLIDTNAVWTGETLDVDPDRGRPADSVATGPPEFDPGTSFAVWSGDAWIIRALADRPIMQPPIPQADPVPPKISPAQAKTALYDAGLYSQVEAILAGTAYTPMRIWWDSALAWRLDNPYIHALAAELDLSDDQVEDLFRQAAKVVL